MCAFQCNALTVLAKNSDIHAYMYRTLLSATEFEFLPDADLRRERCGRQDSGDLVDGGKP